VTFGYLVDWIYGRELVCTREHDDEIKWDHVEGWCALYTLADKLGLDKVKSRALSQYKFCRELWLPVAKEIQYIYENTAEHPGMRASIVQEVAWVFLNKRYKKIPTWVQTMTSTPTFSLDVMTHIKDHFDLDESERGVSYCSAHS
jgi:hypothetical protein